MHHYQAGFASPSQNQPLTHEYTSLRMEASEGARPPTRSAFLKRIGEVASELGYTT